MRRVLFILVVLPFFAEAQFNGGIGRGDSQLAFANTIWQSQFLGGNGRGDVQLAFANTIWQSQFLGGNGRGDVQLAFANTIWQSQFLGGNGRGDVQLGFVPAQITVQIAVRGFLEGPYNASTGSMSDALRTLPSYPLTEPYASLGYAHVAGGNESVAPAVLSTTGSNAIVDWVVVELRDASSPTNIVASKAALLQRDGDVVSTDGVSPLIFSYSAGNFYVALRHRNHLGVMTQSPVALSSSLTGVDFSVASTPTYGTNARKSITGTFATLALFAGDVSFNNEIKYVGAFNDRDPILVAIGGTVPTLTTTGYSNSDVNMDGTVRYVGALNDRDPILVNIGGSVPTNTKPGQLP